jgi:hypothetical protein
MDTNKHISVETTTVQNTAMEQYIQIYIWNIPASTTCPLCQMLQ